MYIVNMENAPTGSMPSSTLFGIVEQQGDSRLSIDELIGFNSPSVFAFEIEGNAMTPYINEGDRLIIDRSKKAMSGDVIVLEYEGQVLCRRFIKNSAGLCLSADNPKCKSISPMKFETWNLIGVVKHVLRSL